MQTKVRKFYKRGARMTKRMVLSLSVIMLVLSGVVMFAAETKPAKLTAVIDVIQRDPDGMTEWVQEFKKMTGIPLEAIAPPHNEYSQKLKLLFAGGNVPDIIEMSTADYVSLASQGMLYPLDDFIKKSTKVKSVNKNYLEAYRMPNGKIYGFPFNVGSASVGYIRADWLKKLNMQMPTTWDQLYAVMKAFKEKDPDGNGKNDTFGYTLSMDVPVSEFDYYNRLIMIDARFDFVKKAKWVDGFTEKEMGPALERFIKLYKEGIIDSEFVTNKTSTARSKFTDGKIGVFEYWSGLWGLRMDQGVKATNKDAVAAPMAPIKGAKYISRIGASFGIYAKSKYPETVFKTWMENQVDKGDGQMFFVYGVKGVHYNVENGKYVFLPKKSNPKEKFVHAYIDETLPVNDWDGPFDTDPRVTKSRAVLTNNIVMENFVIGGPNYVKYAGEIWNLKKEIFAKIVTGKMTVAQGMKEYKDRVKEFKIDEIIKELNTVSKI
jgi:putative aldouronate transport system substrate-binding protein